MTPPADPRAILVVEDDASIRQSIVESLELEGYAVRAAASGAQALREVAASPPAVVFLDLVMPGMSGQEVLDALRADPRTARVPVVVMTAATPALAGPVEGADALLPKPFDLADLIGVAARFCGPPGPADGTAPVQA